MSNIYDENGKYSKYYRGDIFWADLGDCVGREQEKPRPVAIIQNDIGNRYSPTVIIVGITTQVDKEVYPTQFDIEVKRASRVTCEQIKTIDKRRLGDFIRHMTPEELEQLDEKLAFSIGLKWIS